MPILVSNGSPFCWLLDWAESELLEVENEGDEPRRVVVVPAVLVPGSCMSVLAAERVPGRFKANPETAESEA